MTHAEREAAYRATLDPEELARYEAWGVEMERQEVEFRAAMSPEELAGYLAWSEALDHWEDDNVKAADFDARFCNKPADCGRCVLWPSHQGACTRWAGP